MGEGPWRAASMLGITLNFVRFMMMWVKWLLRCVHTERGFSVSRVRVGFFYPVIFLVANFRHCQKYFGKNIFCHKFLVHLKKNAQKK